MENTETRIRPAAVRDIPMILELLAQINLIHYVGRPDIFKLGQKYNEAELTAIIGDDESPVLVATNAEDTCIGYSMCQLKLTKESHVLNAVKTLYIDDLCVSESQRGVGIGKKLYEASLQLARERGCHNVTLNVWECNPAAKRFYEKIGMKVQKTTMEVVFTR